MNWPIRPWTENHNMNKKKIIFLILAIILIPILVLIIPILINYDKTADNTFVLTKNYSHLSRAQILDNLNSDFSLPSQVVLVLPNQKDYNLSLASISASIDRNKMANSMLYRRLNEGILTYIENFFKPKNFNLNTYFNNDQLNSELDNLSTQVEKPFIPSELKLSGSQIIYTLGTTGVSIDREAVRDELTNNLMTAKFDQKINLVTQDVGSIPSQDQVNQTKTRAQKFLGKTIILTADTKETIIDTATIISWLDFNGSYNSDKITQYVKNLAPSFNQDPVDAVFKFENSQVTEFQPAKNGLKLNEEQLIVSLPNYLNELFSSPDKSKTFKIEVAISEPNIKNNDVNDLGIKELLGKGVSTFKHSSATRNINVAKGSSIVNRILVAPGETFSFIKSLGEVSLEAGYSKAYIIKEGKTQLDVGGGVCQVSTTLFRAMLDAGLDITKRQSHAYRVSYYEEDSKPGFDATVFIPNPDLAFINDTGHHVLIQSTYDGINKKLTYEIYGTSDGRVTEIANYRQWGSQPAPPTVYIDDPTLPVGKTIQDEHAVPGLKTSFDWIVKKADGTILHQKTFTSNFVPWAAVYRRGTKI